MARSAVPIALLAGILLLAACCAVADQGAWDKPLMPEFEKAAAKYNVPLPLLLTLGYFGSHFEDRGDAPTIEGGYGVMALRENNFWKADSLGEGEALTKVPKGQIKTHPGSNIDAAAAVLSAYADQMGIDRSKGIEAWLNPVIKYAGLDEEYSRMFAMEIFEKLAAGLDYTNTCGETFQFDPQDIGKVDMSTLEPTSSRRLQQAREEAPPLLPRPSVSGSERSLMTDQYAPAVWYPAASCNYSTSQYNKDTVIIHTIEGTAAGALSWFQNCSADVSAHYVVSEAGGVWQCVDERYTAWHVGCLNSRSIGIENEGYAGSASHPQSLYNACGLLTRDICNSWGIQKQHNACPPGILGHNDANTCVCYGDHWDPGPGWDWNYFISVVNGTSYTNPPYLFGSNQQGWTPGHSTSDVWWIGPVDWNGSIYFDQTGNDCWIYGPATSFTGPWAPQCLNVDFFAQNGSTANHDMQMFWKTNAENYWDAAKSTPIVNYSAMNSWATVNLGIDNAKWWGQTINQLRLDFDQTNHGNRWIINHMVLQNSFWWHFDWAGDVMGWTAGNNMTSPWQYSEGWPGIMVSDQTGNDGFLYSPWLSGGGWPYNYLGGVNDWIHVKVYPQNGTTTAHDMAIYWIRSDDGTWSESKSTHVTFNGKDQWVDVYLPVGLNSTWPAGHITQLRLDFDQTNHGNRWIVDFVRGEHFGADNTAPSVPSGLAATAASQTQVNLTWNASTDGTGVNGYKIYRNDTQIATSIAPSYSDTTCSPNTSYTYKVAAYDAVGNTSAQSSGAAVTTPGGDATPPSVPAGLTATAASGTQINLSWSASTDNVGVTGYKIYRNGAYLTSVTGTSYSNTGLTPATTYSYTVSAYDAAGNNSAQSSPASATTPDTIAPSTPSGLTAVAQSTGQINLSWNASTDNVGVTGYKIYRNGAYLTSVAGTSYANTGLAMGTTYTYTVAAYDAAGNNSSQSASANDSTWIVIDNSSAGFSASANWGTGTMSADKYGADYRFRSTAAVSDAATWNFTIPTTDNYQVYAWWPQGSNRSTTAPYMVYYNGGNQTVHVNQQTNGGVWNSLGTWNFAAGANNVKLSCWTTTGYVVVADAILLIRR